jgi:4-amino-4-deoxychorismate lyase
VYIYHNGNYVKAEEARISPFDHGFMYGLGLFETFRIYDGHPFLLDDHLERLHNGCKEMYIDWSKSKDEMLAILHQLLEYNGWKNAYIRLNITAGIGEIGLQTEPYTKPTELIFAKELPASSPLVEKEGVILNTKRNSPETKNRLKSHHFLNNVIAKREVGPSPLKEGIFLTEDGFLAEGVVSNIFWVKEGILYTPSIDTGILNGITRQFIITLAESCNMTVREGRYREEELHFADEVFVTNSIQEIVPINKISSRVFPGKEGEQTSKLINLYQKFRTSRWSYKQHNERDR